MIFSWPTLIKNSTSSQTICVLYFALSRVLFGPCFSHLYFVCFSIDSRIYASAGKPSLWLLVNSRRFQTTTTTNMIHCWKTHYGFCHRQEQVQICLTCSQLLHVLIHTGKCYVCDLIINQYFTQYH